MVGKARQEEYEAAGHITTTVRKQRVRNVATQLHSSFRVSPSPQPLEGCHPQLEWIFWSRNSLTEQGQGLIFMVILTPIELIIKIFYQFICGFITSKWQSQHLDSCFQTLAPEHGIWKVLCYKPHFK